MKITGRILQFTAGMVIVLALMIFGGGMALAEGEFAGGTGVEGDPYEIANADQLNNVRYHLDAHFELVNGFSLAAYSEDEGWEPIGTWVGVVDPGNDPFTGSFDGGGYTISNLYINRDEADGVGLFGYTNGATIKDVRLENVDITGNSNVGSLVGYNQGGTINGSSADSVVIQGYASTGGLVGNNQGGTIINSNTAGNVTGNFCSIGGLAGSNFLGEISNSYAEVAVQGDYMVGGLVGKTSFGSIESSYATGTVSDIAVPDPESEGYFGGLVGCNDDDATITASYATGIVDGTVYVGGLVGMNRDGGTIAASYATGIVDGADDVGGLVGVNKDGGIITNSYAVGNATGANHVGGLVGYNFLDDPEYDDPMINGCYAKGAVEGTQHIGGLVGANYGGKVIQAYATGAVTGTADVGGLVGSNDDTVTGSYYDSETTGSESGDGESKTTIQMQTPVTFIDWDFAAIWGINPEQNGGYPFFRWQTEYTDAQFAAGTGEALAPYQVATPWQLNNARLYLDKHFILAEDINLAAYLSEAGGGWNDGKGWEPIGKFIFPGSPDNAPFIGSFDGDGHTISNLMINRADKGSIGFFSHTGEDAGIFDLRLTAVEVTGSYYVGGLVGENKGEISNCSIEGSITGNDEVGSLVGCNNAGTITDSYAAGEVAGCIKDTSPPEDIGGLVGNNGGEIDNSYAMVTVNVDGYVNEFDNYEYSYVGGLAGINGGDITNSYATGDVIALYATDDESAGYCIGGLVGFNSAFGSGATITNSYATGEVTGEEYVGGLAGNNGGHITNSYALGEVTGEDYVGGLVGHMSGGTVTASYYDEETTTQNDDGKGTKKTTGEMQLRSTYADWNFLSIWGIEDDEGYPALRWQDGAPQSGFDVTAADSVYMGIEFQLNISQAKGADGDALNGDVSVRVYGETQDEDVVESGISFSDGVAAVPVTLDTSGTLDLRVYAGGVSYSNLLSVEALAVVSIAVTSPPDKINYYVGEEIDLTGLEVTGTYSDDFTGILPITTANISDFDSSEIAANQEVTVTYEGKTDTFTVNIIESQYKSIAVTNPPDKVTYYVGEGLELEGLEVIGTLADDSTEELTITLDNISGFDSSAAATNQVVTVAYQGKTDTFTVDIVTVSSDNANLSGLALSAGTLSPVFEQIVTVYSSSVDSNVSSIEVTPTTADSMATLTINDSGVASGSARSVSLNTGTNIITIVVTAENGTTSKTYTITVNRASPTNVDGGGGGGTQTPSPVNTLTVDSSGNITTASKLDENTGVAAVIIDTATLTTAFEKAAQNSAGKKTVEIVIPEVEGAKAYEATLPASALTSSDANKQLEIKTGIAAVILPTNMLTQETAAGAENISLTIAQADVSVLDEETRNKISDRPVIQLSLKVDGEPYAWRNESGPVTVSIPYTPTAQELANPEHITVWYLDGDGNVVEVPNGRYDPGTGTVTFSTSHFSRYAVVYVSKTFDDLERAAWAKKTIEVLASKGILKGISEKEYAPQTNITRVDFLYYLVRTLGVDAKFEGNFDDIRWDAYYYKEIGIAKKLGITCGTGNNRFSPNESITRMDMMVLTERALRMLKKLDVQGTASDLDRFTDKSLIAACATNSIASVVKEGLIVGSGNRINPLGNTTRAEAAAFLHRIYNKY